jgi:hypothetical protein
MTSDRTVVIPVLNDDRSEAVDPGDARGPFTFGDRLTIYEAAMVYSGRHPGSPFLDSEKYGRASLRDYEKFLGKGSGDPMRALGWYVFGELRRRVAEGAIKPVSPAYMDSGEFNPLDTVIKTADVAALARERGETPEYLAPWMNVPTPTQPPRKKRAQPKRDQAKRLISERYGESIPSEEEVPLSEVSISTEI